MTVRLCIMTTVPDTIQAFWGEAQLKYLQQNDFDVTVLTSTKHSCRLPMSLPAGVTYEAVSMTRTITPWQDFKTLIRIYLILKKGRFDIVQYATPKASLFGSIAGWIAGIPVRLYLMWGLYYTTQRGNKKLIYKAIEKIVCRFSTAIAPDSKENCHFAVEEGLCKKDKIGVVGNGSANGVDTQRFNPVKLRNQGRDVRTELKIPKDAYLFGSIAALVRDKGVNEMIAAFVEIAQKYPNVYLLVIGETADKDPVTKETLKLIKTHERIVNINFQKEPEKYLAAMDAFVLPTYREGFGVVNIEASAMELPVISTDVPGPQESIVNGETGLLVPARTVDPLVKAMSRLIEDRNFGKQLGIAGRQRVKKLYEQKQLWKQIIEHRRGLLKQNRRYEETEEELRRTSL
jgi:glycosyltransferase involved in cell wall biosynthesis